MTGSAIFRFDAVNHEYINPATGALYPHITGMLQQTGWIDDTWYTEESSARGRAVHRLTADYDLGALDVETCVSRYRPYLLGHVKMMQMMPATWFSIEEPLVHPRLHFGGRPDRIGLFAGLTSVVEVKSGGPEKAHAIQTALQALLAELTTRVPADAIGRFAEYLKPNGRAYIERFERRADFDEARKIIRACCAN
jgi:hypothetical protein